MTALRGVMVYDAQADVLDTLTAAMGLLDGSLVALLQAPITPGPNVTLAQVQAAEADYTGYVTGGLEVTTWQAAAKGPAGVVQSDGINLQFLASGVVLSNTIYGAYLTNMAGTALQGVFTLPTPIVMGVDVLQAVDFTPYLRMTGRSTTPRAWQAAVLNSITPALKYLAGAKLRLLLSPITPGPGVTLAQCVAAEATYTGYPAGGTAVTAWQTVAVGNDGVVSVDAQAMQFVASGVVLSNTIYGAFLVDSTGAILINVYSLPVPVVLGVDLLNAVDIQVGVTLNT